MKKNQQKQKGPTVSPVFTMGEFDITLKIDFRDEDLEIKNEEDKKEDGQKYYNLEDLKEIKNLKFMEKNDKIIGRFRVKSKNDMLKLLLIGNQNSSTKTQIDFIPFGIPRFEGDDEFFNEVFDSIMKKTGIIFNKNPLDPNGKYSLKIEMTHKKKKQEINLGSEEPDTHEDDMDIQKEGASKPQEEKPKEEEGDEDDENEDYEENEAMKKKLIPKFKRKKSVLCNLYPSSDKYSMIYLNHADFEKIPGNFKVDDLLELLAFFKKKNSTIFINYYKNEEYKEEEENEDEGNKKGKNAKGKNAKGKNDKNKNDKNKDDKNKNEKNKKDSKKQNNQDEKTKEDENNKNNENENDQNDQNDQNDPKDENQDNQEKKNEKKDKDKKDKGPSKEMLQLNDIYYLTDIYFFDSGQAVKAFDEHYKAFTANDPKKLTINSKNVYHYFGKSIASGAHEDVPCDKTGLFLDEFKRFIIIKVSKKLSISQQEFDCKPFPKINPHNAQEIQNDKKILKKNKNEYYPIFLSNIITSMGGAAPKCVKPEVMYPAFLNGMDIIKKSLEYEKNKIEIPDDDNFYKIKRHPKALEQEIEKLTKEQQEGKFKLDCTNLITSNKKEYVSLYDYHLKNFFSSEIIRNDLKNKGFINEKGYIMYDPVYRSVMGANVKNKKKKPCSSKEKQEKILSSIKDIEVQNRIQDKEIDAQKAAENENTATLNKIPYVKEKKKHKKKRKKDGEGSSGEGSSGSGSSDDENRSGEENGNSSSNIEGQNES